MQLLERVEKYYFTEEAEAEQFIESQKETEGELIDRKLSVKETSKEFYVIVTLKKRFQTLAEAKES